MKLDKNGFTEAPLCSTCHCSTNIEEFYSAELKNSAIVSYGAHGPNVDKYRTMSIHTRIYSMEAYGILPVAQHILEKIPKPIKYTDALSVLHALASHKPCKNHIDNIVFNSTVSTFAQNLNRSGAGFQTTLESLAVRLLMRGQLLLHPGPWTQGDPTLTSGHISESTCIT